MKNKPFIWLQVNRLIDLNQLKEFNDSMVCNFGLALSPYAFRKNSLECLNEINSDLKIPMAYFIEYKADLTDILPEFIQKKLISLETMSLRVLLSDENYTPCYRLHFPKNKGIETGRLVSDLSDYFLFKSSFPLREAIVGFNSDDRKLFPEICRIMEKLGMKTLMTLYEKNNLSIVQAYFNDKTSGIKTDFPQNPKIFDEWRTQVDALDNQLIEILAKRLQVVSEMGAYKSQRAMPLFEAERWREIIRSRKEIAKTKGVDEYFIEKIFEAIHLLGLKKMLEE